jgi:hypothetical protein
MAFGIALLVIGGLGTMGLAGLLLASTSQGTIELGSLLALGPRSATITAAVVGFAAASTLLAGAFVIRRERGLRGHVAVQDDRARAAEDEARARLLALRLEQLERDVETLEVRRASALGELHAPAGSSEPILVLVSETGEPNELSRRLASSARTRTLRR